MKFYGREVEIAILRKEREVSHRHSRFTVVTGRRRVGKTELIDKALNDGTDDYLYLLFSFSILSSIATGHTRYSEIECDLSLELGSFITNLEKNYHLVKRVLPVYASRGAKNASYRIEDPFFRFWFRYVFRNVQLVELGRFEILRKMVADDLDVFTGQSLEQYFWWKFAKESDYISMGAWWDRKGENEIDLVCERPAGKKRSSPLTFFEVKRDAARIDLNALKAKVSAFFEKHPEMKNGEPLIEGLSLKDM